MVLPQPKLRIADYQGRQPPIFRRMRFWSLTHWLVAINVGVFILQVVTGDEWIPALGGFSINRAVYHLQLWRWVTSDFIHWDAGHLLGNMMALWVFGPVAEARLGKKRFIAFYLLCGLAGTFCFVFLCKIGIVRDHETAMLAGASGCILGLIVAAAVLSPNATLRFAFSGISVRFITVAWFVVGFAILNVFRQGSNAGGDAAHLGGALAGYVLIRNVSFFRLIGIGPRRQRFWRPGDPPGNFFRSDL